MDPELEKRIRELNELAQSHLITAERAIAATIKVRNAMTELVDALREANQSSQEITLYLTTLLAPLDEKPGPN